ncbi:MAG TPA: FAD-dependent oxidoreductase [Devosiaceae bacterium]|jgi:predicted NAD/FAD-binding protein
MSGRIAIIGSGISGLSTAWLLSKSRDVTLIESAPRLGGHTNTLWAETADGPVAVDTGFIVFNEQNYPNLTAFLAHLGVATAPSEMSFAVSADRGRMEYSGRHLKGLFGQCRNLVRPRHWQMVADILRFFRSAEMHAAEVGDAMGIGELLARFGYSEAFIEDHILPISAAIWSTPARGMLDFPARTFISFFANHGLLQVGGRPLWRTIAGGAQHYVDAILADSRFGVLTDAHIAAVARDAGGVDLLFATGEHRRFDAVVFACHADQALGLLADPSPEEHKLLSAFRFTPNRAVLHTDRRLMPRRRHLWSAWNYLRTGRDGDAELSLTYWMNRLQPLPTTTDIFVTLNPMHDFAPGTVQRVIDYEHPLFDGAACAAQRDMWKIQGDRRTWFAGAWLGHGFHEDGLQAGLEIAERLGRCTRPWSVPEARGRIAHNWSGEAVKWAAE